MSTMHLALAVAAIMVFAGCKELPPSAAPVKKNVLALQAFLDPGSDQRIMSICSTIKNVEGYQTELGNPFKPHITLASWRATPAEFLLAESQFRKRLAGLNCAQAEMTLQEEEGNGRLYYFLLPEPTPPLLRFHSQVHSRLSWGYQQWRPTDFPGKWTPHLTLFSVPKSQRHAVSDALLQLRRVRAVRIESIGMLEFGPKLVTTEVKLVPDRFSD